jgi:hypothetical protein
MAEDEEAFRSTARNSAMDLLEDLAEVRPGINASQERTVCMYTRLSCLTTPLTLQGPWPRLGWSTNGNLSLALLLWT